MALIPRLSANAGLARRAAAVLAKCANRVPKVTDMLLKEASAFPGLVAALVSEGAAHEAIEDAPRVVDVTDVEDPLAEAAAEAEAEEAAATEEEMVGSAVCTPSTHLPISPHISPYLRNPLRAPLHGQGAHSTKLT